MNLLIRQFACLIGLLLARNAVAQSGWLSFKFAGGYTVSLPEKPKEIATLPGMADMENSKAWLCSGNPVSYYLSVGDLDRKANAAARFVFPVLVVTIVKDLKLLRSEREYLLDGWPCLAFTYEDGVNLQEVRVCLIGRKMILLGATAPWADRVTADFDRFFSSLVRPDSVHEGPISELKVPWTAKKSTPLGFVAEFPSDYVQFDTPYGRPRTLTAQYLSTLFQFSYVKLSDKQIEETHRDLKAARENVAEGILKEFGTSSGKLTGADLAGEAATSFEGTTANGLLASGVVLFHRDLMCVLTVSGPKIHANEPIVKEFFARFRFIAPAK